MSHWGPSRTLLTASDTGVHTLEVSSHLNPKRMTWPLSGHCHVAGLRGRPTLSPGLGPVHHTSLEFQSQTLFSLYLHPAREFAHYTCGYKLACAFLLLVFIFTKFDLLNTCIFGNSYTEIIPMRCRGTPRATLTAQICCICNMHWPLRDLHLVSRTICSMLIPR